MTKSKNIFWTEDFDGESLLSPADTHSKPKNLETLYRYIEKLGVVFGDDLFSWGDEPEIIELRFKVILASLAGIPVFKDPAMLSRIQKRASWMNGGWARGRGRPSSIDQDYETSLYIYYFINKHVSAKMSTPVQDKTLLKEAISKLRKTHKNHSLFGQSSAYIVKAHYESAAKIIKADPDLGERILLQGPPNRRLRDLRGGLAMFSRIKRPARPRKNK